MKLYTCLKPDAIIVDCKATNTESLLKELIHHLKMNNRISDEDYIYKKLMEREKMGSTSVGNHSAVPHARIKDIKDVIVAVGLSRNGIIYSEIDKEVSHFFVLILAPNSSPIVHLQVLAAAATLIKKPGKWLSELLECQHPSDVIHVIQNYEEDDE